MRLRPASKQAGLRVALDPGRGLDHGAWVPLGLLYPEADVPTAQLAIQTHLGPAHHLRLGTALRPLREEGVLILGSGNVTHNLADAGMRRRTGSTETPPWAARFDEAVARIALAHDAAELLKLWPDSEDGRLSHPTPDHFFPLLYAFGAAQVSDPVSFPATGFDLGSLSMRSILFG